MRVGSAVMRLPAVALLVALSLSACGGGGGYDDTAALGEALGCAGYELDPADTLPFGAKETATCDAGDGRDFSLAVFGDDEARDIFVEALSAVGGTFVVGPGWAVGAPTVADAKRAADRLDGKVV